VLTPAIIIICSFISKERLVNRDPVFLKKFGSLYDEFKNNKGFWSSQFYFFYFVRRLAYTLSQVYLNDHLFVQGIINIGISIMQLVYLLVYTPFKESTILMTNIIGEAAATLVFIQTFFFLFQLSQKNSQILEMVVIFTVIGGMGAQFIVSIISLIKTIRSILTKFAKMRALAFAKAGNNIITFSQNH
jgi:hypothetical protein